MVFARPVWICFFVSGWTKQETFRVRQLERSEFEFA